MKEKNAASPALPRILLAILGVLIILLALVQVVFSNHLATFGVKIREYQERQEQLLTQKGRLEQEIVSLSSLSRIASESAKLGLVKASSIVHLDEEIPVALKP